MTNKQNPKFQELVAKLREIFQIDRPELDFGIYRILNARAGEINDYLQNRLAEKVQAALSAGSAASAQQLQADLDEAIKQAQTLGANPDDLPKVKDLRAKLKDATAGNSEHENAVFSHLLAFFSRYYQDGDFISQRRYKGDTYAIPYAGEEVMLHWANKDQYYTKSGESFSNYSFKLENGRTVHFRLAAADTAKDNRKDNDKERRFALVAAKTVTRLDENGDEYEEELVPVEEASGSDGNQELIIRFEYAAQPKGTKQEALVTRAVEAVLADAAVKARWLALGNRAPTEKNPQRTLLEKHLSDYTTKNTADYFIHKDLGGFLRRELDFYIKNEVMHLDDVQNASAFADIEKNLRMIQCLRSIALELITFLAQLEDFQKKLWLKKKFVVSCHYCITLDRVPEGLWPEVVANAQQWARWKQLGVWDSDAPGTVQDLKAAPYRMVDTSLFDGNFTQRLLSNIEKLDERLDGLVIHGENSAGIKLLERSIEGAVSNIYIDPPYNTGDDGFLYKDSYVSSSWMSMMDDRLSQGVKTLSEDGVMFVSIGDEEQEHLSTLVRQKFGKANLFATLVWEKKKKGSFLNGKIVRMKDYILCVSKDESKTDGLIGEINSESETYPVIKTTNARGLRIIKAGIPSKFKEKDHRLPAGTRISSGNMELILKSELVIERGILAKDVEVDSNWIYGQESLDKYAEDKSLYITQDLYFRRVVNEARRKRMRDLLPRVGSAGEGDFRQVDVSDLGKYGWGTNEDANDELHQLLGEQYAASYPKPSKLLTLLLASSRHSMGYWMDYFAGSGTTGHAVINLNRIDGGNRKFVLMEQGDYFETVLKPRLQKVVFSTDWKDGKPTAPETGISHCFKVLKLESYEDTLNNLQLRRTSAQGDLLNTLPQQAKDDYLLNYLLDVESRGSLLSVEDFRKPFDYTLNVAVDSAGAFEPRKIDLVETFNFLIGMRVKHIDAQPQRGFVTVTGALPSNETCLVLWRDCDVLDYEGISKLCDKLAINPADNEFDVVYINGDHNIPTVLTQTAEEGGATRVLKLRQIEPEFLERMFSVEDI